jgi:integrase
MRRISPRVLQQWVAELLRTKTTHTIRTREGTQFRETDETLSRKSVANVVGLLARCLDFALVAGKVKTNPARVLILPPEPVRDDDDESTQLITHLTLDEIAALFRLPLSTRERALFSVAVYVGLSKGEILGLRWQDLTLDGADPHARVRKSYDAALKTKRRRRDVPLLAPARAALTAWKATLEPTPIAGLVFAADGGGCHNRSYTAGWRDQPMTVGDAIEVRPGLRSRAGIRDEVAAFHALRHTCGSHLLQGTWAPRYLPRALTMQEVSKWLGHSSIAVTERHYAALSNDSLRRAVRVDGENPGEIGAGEKST